MVAQQGQYQERDVETKGIEERDLGSAAEKKSGV